MELEEKHKCKLCWKSFVNGRALGGHMRSHMRHHPLPIQVEPASSSMADPGFALQDRESETESSKNPTRKRSRLHRRSTDVSLRHQKTNEEEEEDVEDKSETTAVKIIRAKRSQELTESCTEQEPMSSVSDAATAEEDVAFSLMMLSRDKWEKEESGGEIRWDKKKEKKKWFECETCEKVFKSYQALGGHRASHKKKRALEGSSSSSSSSCVILVSDEMTEKKSSGHECPICLKVFSSGQALGGHKRSHATATATGLLVNSPAKRGIISFIDLNLPAPLEDEDLVSDRFLPDQIEP